ncbi:MAG: hypothetical protein U0175_04625 [Caldilineaceae bacterium]
MELDDLKTAWQTLDRRLTEQNSNYLEWRKERKLGPVKSALRPALIGNLIQLLVGLAMEFLFAPFWVQHLDTPYLLISGLLLHGYALMFVIYAGREITLILKLDYSGSVLAIQKQLHYLQTWRQRMAPHLGIVGSVIWIPLVLVILNGWGVEIALNDPSVLAWLVSSLLVSLGVLFALIKWAHIFGDSATGWNILRARTMLDELVQFEQE